MLLPWWLYGWVGLAEHVPRLLGESSLLLLLPGWQRLALRSRRWGYRREQSCGDHVTAMWDVMQ